MEPPPTLDYANQKLRSTRRHTARQRLAYLLLLAVLCAAAVVLGVLWLTFISDD